MTDRITQLENLSPAKRALLVKLLRQDASRACEPETISPRPNKALAPLSFAQQRLWILDQLQPGNPFYNIPVAIRLSGRLDRPALEASLREIVRRHEALRTTFSTIDERPMQRIAASSSIHLSVDDLSALPVATREVEARRRATEEAQLPFDLARGPLARLTLLRLGEEEHVLLLTMHHIVSDGWSMGLLVQELATLYEAFTRGKPSPLPDLSIQYGDFAHWQREWMEGEVLQEQLSYWRDRLKDLPALQLPADRSRPSVQTFRGASHAFTLSEPLSESLRALSRREGATLFMTLLASFQTLLSRYSGQTDVVVGSPIAGRNRSEIEGLIGFFVNMLVMRADLSRDPSFRELLHTVIEAAVGAYANQDLPFERLVEALQPERSLSHEPLFQVAFAMQNFPVPAVDLPAGLRIRPFESDFGIAKFDLMLFMWESPGALSGLVEYSTDLFDAETIERLVEHFQTLLEGIVADPDRCVSTLRLTSEAERRELLVRWNDTEVVYPAGSCIHDLFADQAERAPDRVAVVSAEQHLSYGELERQSNRLAHHLQGLGVGPDVRVGICAERSVAMMVGILGILKAGGCYVPMDPEFPAQRLLFLLRDASIQVVLTQEHLLARLPEHSARVVCLDGDGSAMAGYADRRPPTGVRPDNLVYVMYTSGSTGRPKGVGMTSAALVNLLRWQEGDVPDSSRRTLAFAPITFDVSFQEMFSTLLSGEPLVLLSRDQRRDMAEVSEAVRTHSVERMFLPFVALRELAQHADSVEKLSPLQEIITAGERLQIDEALGHFFGKSGDCRLVNQYGPTEAHVVTSYELPIPITRSPALPPIGRPISNVQMYALDSHLEPVPVGVAGELHIGGACLARGYLGRAELTAEKFIPDLFSRRPGSRLYKTGDLCRWNRDGNLEFLGRIDHQLKVRGYRIEPGEIEAALRQLPEIEDAVVVAQRHGSSGQRLVAYVVPAVESNDSAPQEQELVSRLRASLGAQLPHYMVPHVYVTLPALPLLSSGKVDRRALPAPDGSRPELNAAYVAPRTEAEEELVRIWSDVLGVDRVGVHDNFFELGGDSILAIQAIHRARQAGMEFTPIQLFQHQTISGLAQVASTATPIHAEQGPVEGPVPLTPIQHWFFEQDLLDKHHFNMAVMFNVTSSLDTELLETAITSIVRHHDALWLSFDETPDGWTQQNAAFDEARARSALIRRNLAELSERDQSEAIERFAVELQTSLNLNDPPLIRIAHFDLGPDKPSRLMLVAHHLAIDGVSWRILVEDLLTVYQQLQSGIPVVLFPKTTSFKHWAERLIEHAQSQTVRDELAYWRRVCAEADASLPLDLDEEANTAGSADSVSVSLSQEDTAALLRDVPSVYHTQINDLLLTALAEAVVAWTGGSSLFLTLEGHGREKILGGIDVSRTVGWFTSMFPVRLELAPERSIGDSIKTIKEQLRSIPNRGVGYGLLRYSCGDDSIREELRSFPEPQLSFNYLGQFDQSKFDRSLFAAELARESIGPIVSPRDSRKNLVDVSGAVGGGRLVFDWVFSTNRHRRQTIERVAECFITRLKDIIEHCQTPEAGAYTPSDFPMAGLTEDQLENVLSQVEFEGVDGV